MNTVIYDLGDMYRYQIPTCSLPEVFRPGFETVRFLIDDFEEKKR
jgi:hypothetical protein